MRTFKFIGVICMLLTATSQTALSQANRNLSNLLSPTAVNQHLLPNSNNARDLGSNSKRWKNLFLANKEGININPSYPLDIYNNTYFDGIHVNNDYSSTSDHIGVYSESIIADGWGYGVQGYGGYRGVYGEADGGAYTGSSIGVLGQAFGTDGSRYGVYGYATGGSFNAAGYFDGDVWAYNYFYISDRKFKTNISSIQSPLEQLMKLKPSVYEFKTSEYPNMALPKGKQMGLIADEVKAVFPDLVKEAVHPAEYGKDKTVLLHPAEKYEGVNYAGLIPVLIAAMQEQQKTIEAIKAENEELNSRLNAIEQALNTGSKPSVTAAIALNGASLGIAVPNPANRQTVISYYLPQHAGNAVINISNMNGTVIKSIPIAAQGKGQIVLDVEQFAAGTYNYALIVGGKLADSKKLVLTK